MRYFLYSLRSLYLLVFFFQYLLLHAQVQTVQVNFEQDIIGELPMTSPGNGSQPSSINGDANATMQVENRTGNPGNSTASGKVAAVNVPTPGNFRLLDFSGLLNSGIVSTDSVWVGFDFMAFAGIPQGGFAFLRCFDESDETFADIGFSFLDNGYTVGLLDYDPVTGDYLGWREPPFPNNYFDNGTWYRFEAMIDLNNNQMRLQIDGVDYGVVGGISRATGEGYAGAFFNWGTAFSGKCAIDNFSVRISNNESLPPPPPGFDTLLIPKDHGGTVLRLPCGDFRQRGIDWGTSGSAQLVYDSIYTGVSIYRSDINTDLDEADSRLFSFKSFPTQPNRTYEVSALIRTDFPRATWELNLGVHGADSQSNISLGARYGGMPAITTGPDGWQRWTWRFTPHWDDRYPFANIFLGFHEYGPGFDGNFNFEIADLAFVELPAQPLTPFAPGEGVTFPGGAGNLPMQIENVAETTDSLRVTVSGAIFHFDKSAGTLSVEQRIDFKRILTQLTNLSLTGLSIQVQNTREVVLVSNDLTIGVQMDGAVVISPHVEWTTEIESKIGGDFNRFLGGDLLSQDDFGGFTANLYTPKGTGLVPRINLMTNGLSFDGLDADDLSTPGAAAPGWKANATISPGERLFISAFPSRPYDWAKSFDYHWALSDFYAPLEYDDPPYVDSWVLWNISQRGWAMSFGERYEVRNNVPYQSHIDAIIAENDKWSAYFSQWFYYSRDAEEWTNEVKRWRDTYGMGAVYSDGMAQDDWLSAYEAMRRLRQDVFPDGDIIIHDSYPQSGIAAAAFRPFIYSYATSTYMGENADASGADWAWSRYAMGQFRRANCFGVTKGDRWAGVNGVDKYLIGLVWGGRGRPDVSGYQSVYLPILNQLKSLWQTYGNDPYFFDRYYHPEAQLLTGFEIGRAGMPIIQLDTLSPNTIEVSASSWTPNTSIYYTLDGTPPTTSSPEYTAPIIWDGEQALQFRAFRTDLDDSRIAVLGQAPSIPLPVELSYLKAESKGCQTLIKWASQSEFNHSKYILEKSTDAAQFFPILEIPGNGNSYEIKYYEHLDKNPDLVNYYRLRQVDLDGKETYSQIVTVRNDQCLDLFDAFQVSPNPSNGLLYIRGDLEGYTISIIDVNGREVQAFRSLSSGILDASQLPAGVYFMKFQHPDKRSVMKRIVME